MKLCYKIELTHKNFWLLSFYLLLAACRGNIEPLPILEFEEIAIISGESLPQATGFTGSKKLNSLYIVSRETDSSFKYVERVLKYDLDSDEEQISTIVQPDFITKNAHLLNDKLLVVSATRVNTYPENLDVAPESSLHSLSLSRFGSAIYEEDVYVWGGDLNAQTSNYIRRWNFETEDFEKIGELPLPRTWAQGEIFRNKLFVFGGQEEFTGTEANDIIYSYDLQSHKIKTYFLPETMSRTFTATQDNMIYVAGHVVNDENEVTTILGVFNTYSTKFTTLQFTPAYEIAFGNILQMTIVDNKLYMLYGPLNANIGLSLQVADL